ncbi:hypothetical protein [Candidatus Mycobacterium methanotrophicum]|uniref:Uncharacterized protein n=1 Tax=Candidatus Mycobacterium methanotrophicum TaxID=2943498 RepID=A0ABY4QGC1_9MYCO|nr:hypothetical protein [Candidatus Mycobacterium methanotrophicum]UQX09529.1 hypothetical protein M5I08_14155 [Candidatus Mycobacterium methanotrophicum]
MFEKHPARHGFVQHLGQGEFGLQDRELVAVARGPVARGERVRRDGQPLAQQRVDLLFAEPIADRLRRGGIIDGGEPVV